MATAGIGGEQVLSNERFGHQGVEFARFEVHSLRLERCGEDRNGKNGKRANQGVPSGNGKSPAVRTGEAGELVRAQGRIIELK